MKDESESCRHFIEILSQIYYKFFTKSNFTNAMDNKWNIKIVETEAKAVWKLLEKLQSSKWEQLQEAFWNYKTKI